MSWICPHCHELLEKSGGSLVCVNGHTLDVAREGYVNLLVGRQKSGHKGDTPEMLAARRRHFERGLYEPLRARLVELVGGMAHGVVAEIGCGEGYYVGGMAEALGDVRCFGTDIAKEGVRMGARKYPRVSFAVADTNVLVPLPDGSVDVLLDVFAPRNAAEFARVLKTDGRLLVVIPAAAHLAELRDVQPLLAIQEDKRRLVEEGLGEYLRLESAETLSVSLELDSEAAADLVGMTPNAWFLTEEQKGRLAGVSRVGATGEFEILVFQRK